jgi:hypothetical protein
MAKDLSVKGQETHVIEPEFDYVCPKLERLL